MIDHVDNEYKFENKKYWEYKHMNPHIATQLDVYKFFPDKYKNATWVTYALEFNSTDGKINFDITPTEGCFGTLSYNEYYNRKNTAFRNFYCALRHRTDVDITKLIKFLFDKSESPFRNVLYDFEIKPNYFRLKIDNDTSSQLVIGLAIAARMGLDSPGSVKLFNVLLEKGFTSIEAFYVSLYFMLNKAGAIVSCLGHDIYAFSSRKTNSFSMLKNANPRLNSKYTMYKGYGSLQKMWITNKELELNIYSGGSEIVPAKIYKIFDMEGEYKGNFEKYFVNSGKKNLQLGKMPTLEEIISKKELIFKECA